MRINSRRAVLSLLMLLAMHFALAFDAVDNPDDSDGWDGTSSTYGQDIHDFEIDTELNNSSSDDGGSSSSSSGGGSSTSSSGSDENSASDSDSSQSTPTSSEADDSENHGKGSEYDDYPEDEEIEVDWDENFLDGYGFSHNGETYATVLEVRDGENTVTFITYSDVYDKDGNFIFDYKGPGDRDEINARLVEIFGGNSEYAGLDATTLLSHYVSALKELDDAKKAGEDAKKIDEINAKLDEIRTFLDRECEKNAYTWTVSSTLNFGVITNKEGKTIFHAGDPVIFASGDFIIDDCDMSVKLGTTAFDITRHYSSLEACAEQTVSGIFGPGWSSSLDTRLVFGAARTFSDALPCWDAYMNVLAESEARAAEYAREDASCVKIHNELLALSAEAAAQYPVIAEKAGLSNEIMRKNEAARYGHAASIAEYLPFDTLLYCQAEGGFLAFEKDADDSYHLLPQYGMSNVSLTREDDLFCLSFPEHGEKRYFHESGLPSHYTYRNGSILRFLYDEKQRLLWISIDGKKMLSFLWKEGRLDLIRDLHSGKTTEYGYDDGFLVSVTDWEGDMKSFSYNDDGILEKQIRADGTFVKLSFAQVDGTFRTVSTTNELNQVEYFNYDSEQKCCEHWNYEGDKFTFFYDGKGRTVRAEYEGKSVLDYEYDENSRLHSRTDDYGKTEFVYDEHGNMILKIYPDGSRESWTYRNNMLSSFTDTEGNHLDYAYTSQGQISDLFQDNSLLIHFEYSESGLPSEMHEAGGKKTELFYNEFGNLISRKSVQGQEESCESWEYDESGNLRSYTDALGRSTVYKTSPHEIVMTSSDGLEITERYSGRKLLLSRAFHDTDTGEKRIFSYKYDDAKNLTEIYVSGRTSWGTEVEKTSLPVNTQNPFAGFRTVGTACEGVAPEKISELSFDACGRLVSNIMKDKDGKLLSAKRFSYGRRWIELVFGGQYREKIELNAFDEIIARTDGNGNRRSFRYDILGRLVSEADAYGNETSYSYNKFSQLERVTFPDGAFICYKYDDSGNETEAYDELGMLWKKEYDELGRVRAVSASPYPHIQRFEYDDFGSVSSLSLNQTRVQETSFSEPENKYTLTDGCGNSKVFHFDELGRLVSWRNALGKSSEIQYDDSGKLKSLTDFNGKTKKYTYGTDGRSFSVSCADGEFASYEYDDAGNLLRAKNADSDIAFVYDAGGMLVRQIDMRSDAEIRYEYDSAQNLIRIKSADRDISYSWGKNQELVKVTERILMNNDASVSWAAFTYDSMGREIRADFDSGEYTKSFYDVRGRLILKLGYNSEGELIFVNGSVYDASGAKKYSIDSDFQVTAFSYDDFGRIASVSYPYAEALEEKMKRDVLAAGLFYSDSETKAEYLSLPEKDYAALQNLVSLAGNGSRPVSPLQQVLTEHFKYDLNNNVIEKRNPYNTVTYRYDGDNRLLAWGKNCSAVYDSNGNLIEEKTAFAQVTYTYTAFDRIKTVKTLDFETNACFEQHNVYDAFSRRISCETSEEGVVENTYIGQTAMLFDSQRKMSFNSPLADMSSVRYTFIGDEGYKRKAQRRRTVETRVSPSYDGRGRIYSYYSAGETSGEGKHLLFSDEQGSVRAEVGPDRLVMRYAYDIFGDVIERPGRFGFIGKQYSALSALYDFGYRDYKSSYARFSSQDPAHAAMNLYAYCDGNPVQFFDSDGLYPIPVKAQHMQDMGHTLLGNSSDEYTDLEGCVVTSVAEALTALTGTTVTNDYVNSQKDCFGSGNTAGCVIWGNLETVFGLRDKNEFLNDRSVNNVLTLRESYNKYQETIKAIEDSVLKAFSAGKIEKAQAEAAKAIAHVDKVTETLSRLTNEVSPIVVVAQVGYGKSGSGNALLHYVPIDTKIETVRGQQVVAITPTSRSDRAEAVPGNSYRPNVGWFVENGKVYVPITLINRIEPFSKAR
ncbi:MAG: RHS repeat-associated core domain-containing protein [Treponema sp.]|nr:RHS repeat-associated core domain-containing protein [Treponema sp.]